MEINKAISILAEHLLVNGLNVELRKKAKDISRSIYINDLSDLRQLFHNPPNKPNFYSVEKYGLGGWLSSCQFAIFEIIYNIGEEALPFVREIAWGKYDWTQGNAIELLIRFASEGIQSEELISEIKKEYPNIRYEAQLYAIQPLINELETNQSLRKVFDQLFEIEDFKDAYDEITYVDPNPDPHNIFKEELYGKVVSRSKINEKVFKKLIVAVLHLEDFKYGEFSFLYPLTFGRISRLFPKLNRSLSDLCKSSRVKKLRNHVKLFPSNNISIRAISNIYIVQGDLLTKDIGNQ